MAFNAGEIHKNEIYTGLAKMEVVAVNPTLEELAKMGAHVPESLDYKSRGEHGENKLRVDIWLRHEANKILVPVKFYLSDRASVSSKGNTEFINGFGTSAYADSLEALVAKKYPWLEASTLRPAFEGEVNLVAFIKAWLCIAREEMACIDDWTKLISGDLGEITSLMALKPAPETKEPKYLVQVLLYVNDNGFLTVFNRFFSRMDSNNVRRWIKYMDNSNYDLNFGGDYNLKIHNTTATPSTFKEEGPAPDQPSAQAWGTK